jgi:hypothetical protein
MRVLVIGGGMADRPGGNSCAGVDVGDDADLMGTADEQR